jgi:hypothetical protein
MLMLSLDVSSILTSPTNQQPLNEVGVLLRAQQARMSLSINEQSLSNRLRLLELEESRIMRKINETRRQAERIQEVQGVVNQKY